MTNMRPKQIMALEFIEKAYTKGYRDIVISLPTGGGKSAVAIAACHWASTLGTPDGGGVRGGYYLVTQKLLQDQLENDIPRYEDRFKNAASLKTASEYVCPLSGNCGTGRASKRKHACESSCAYRMQKALFESSTVAITNYPYFFTEKTYIGAFPKRNLTVCDETHTVENQIIRFVDVTLTREIVKEFAPELDNVEIPKLETCSEYFKWIEETYVPVLSDNLKSLLELAESDDAVLNDALKLKQHTSKVLMGLNTYRSGRSEWAFWKNKLEKGLEYIARPLHAGPFIDEMIRNSSDIRLYMSAYPGVKSVFCRSLGLKEDEVAWASLGSTFKPENRPVVIAGVGSMSKKNQEQTLPALLRFASRIMSKHKNEKGIIHCHSYALGNAIYEYFQKTEHASRFIFPRSGEERESAYNRHCAFDEPSVLLTPSMTEGFDFKDNLARWQIIPKVPYASLGDKQVVMKMEEDPQWYALQTVMTIIQATGRICRSENDFGKTYILDSDFNGLWNRFEEFFPKWYKSAVTWI